MNRIYPIVGFHGAIGSGKTTAARGLGRAWAVEGFADHLKEMAEVVVGFRIPCTAFWGSQEEKAAPLGHGLKGSGRGLLKFLGAGLRECLGEDFWVRQVLDPPRPYPLAIHDVRYPNEFEAIKSRGGIVIGLLRNCDTHDQTAHESDVLRFGLCDVVIDNRDMTVKDTSKLIQDQISRVFG